MFSNKKMNAFFSAIDPLHDKTLLDMDFQVYSLYFKVLGKEHIAKTSAGFIEELEGEEQIHQFLQSCTNKILKYHQLYKKLLVFFTLLELLMLCVFLYVLVALPFFEGLVTGIGVIFLMVVIGNIYLLLKKKVSFKMFMVHFIGNGIKEKDENHTYFEYCLVHYE